VNERGWQANRKYSFKYFSLFGGHEMAAVRSLVVALATLACAFAGLTQEHGLQVQIDTGTILGQMQGPTRTFLGVPYAAPPVGELRWKPPAPAVSWSGVRSAAAFGSHCLQGPVYDDMVFHDAGGSEDCLTLNVWTPAKDAAAKLPVMVWIYGGGYVAGTTSEGRQDGQFLALHNVVVVSMNYRLGIFGFFTLPELAAESGRNAAGDYGLLDQVAALQWVQRNIASFGGDPSNVTIFGESAGSFSVSALMASPLAHGLFDKAIGESGAAFSSSGLPFKTLAEREQQDSDFAASALGTKSLRELRAIPAQKMLDATWKTTFGPDVDGYFLPESAPAIFAAKKENLVPLLAGWNRDEGSFEMSADHPATRETMKALATKEFGGKADEFLRLYPADTDEVAKRSMEDFAGDRFIAWSTWRWLEAVATAGQVPVYRYRFDRSLPNDAKDKPGLGAYHSAEIEYVFGTLDSKSDRLWTKEDREISALIQKYWVNFARSGDPNAPGLPQWPLYRAAGDWPVMHFNAESATEKDALRPRYVFLSGAWGH
jgi:para-nitrobenzyl esterase